MKSSFVTFPAYLRARISTMFDSVVPARFAAAWSTFLANAVREWLRLGRCFGPNGVRGPFLL